MDLKFESLNQHFSPQFPDVPGEVSRLTRSHIRHKVVFAILDVDVS